MNEAVDAGKDATKEDKIALAKIKPENIEENSLKPEPFTSEDTLFAENTDSETSLIKALILLLRHHGIRKSGAAVGGST